jgi:hypothetical protein
MRAVVATGMLALALGLAGCTGGGSPPRSGKPPLPPTATVAQPGPVAWDLDAARVDRVPRALDREATTLPRSFPSDDATLPDLHSDPPGRAVLAYHPREWFEGGGWASERVLLLGVDGRWRSLELDDLDVPESAWPGPDTYGAGELSPDGRLWAGRTNDGALFVDLGTGRSRQVAIPGSKYSSYAAWRADGSRLDVVQYLHGEAGRTTWSMDPRTDEARRSARSLPPFGRSPRGTLRSLVAQGVPRDHVEYGALVGPTYTLLALRRSVLAVDGSTAAPVARLRSGLLVHAWLDGYRLLVSHGPSGLVVWHVDTGSVELVTRVPPRTGAGRYWSASVATDLLG